MPDAAILPVVAFWLEEEGSVRSVRALLRVCLHRRAVAAFLQGWHVIAGGDGDDDEGWY